MVVPQKLESVKWAWMNGEIIPFADTKVHAFAPGFRYGLGVMEGLRAYWNESQKQLYLIKLEEHFRRLTESAKIMRFKIGYGYDKALAATKEVIRANDFKEDLHLRHYVYLDGFGAMESTEPIGSFIICYPRTRMHEEPQGIRCCVSSWQRISDNVFPPRIKLGGNYQNSRLAKYEAKLHGYDDGILLNQQGKVTEASAAALLMIRDGELAIPPRTSGVLESLTRKAVIKLLREEKELRTVERDIDRTELYVAEELFMCGTGAEVTPIISVDGLPVGDGKPGPITTWLQKRYFAVVRGEVPAYVDWLTPVYGE